jgi:hypothetical protein
MGNLCSWREGEWQKPDGVNWEVENVNSFETSAYEHKEHHRRKKREQWELEKG